MSAAVDSSFSRIARSGKMYRELAELMLHNNAVSPAEEPIKALALITKVRNPKAQRWSSEHHAASLTVTRFLNTQRHLTFADFFSPLPCNSGIKGVKIYLNDARGDLSLLYFGHSGGFWGCFGPHHSTCFWKISECHKKRRYTKEKNPDRLENCENVSPWN